jgi:hypothetical protein
LPSSARECLEALSAVARDPLNLLPLPTTTVADMSRAAAEAKAAVVAGTATDTQKRLAAQHEDDATTTAPAKVVAQLARSALVGCSTDDALHVTTQVLAVLRRLVGGRESGILLFTALLWRGAEHLVAALTTVDSVYRFLGGAPLPPLHDADDFFEIVMHVKTWSEYWSAWDLVHSGLGLHERGAMAMRVEKAREARNSASPSSDALLGMGHDSHDDEDFVDDDLVVRAALTKRIIESPFAAPMLQNAPFFSLVADDMLREGLLMRLLNHRRILQLDVRGAVATMTLSFSGYHSLRARLASLLVASVEMESMLVVALQSALVPIMHTLIADVKGVKELNGFEAALAVIAQEKAMDNDDEDDDGSSVSTPTASAENGAISALDTTLTAGVTDEVDAARARNVVAALDDGMRAVIISIASTVECRRMSAAHASSLKALPPHALQVYEEIAVVSNGPLQSKRSSRRGGGVTKRASVSFDSSRISPVLQSIYDVIDAHSKKSDVGGQGESSVCRVLEWATAAKIARKEAEGNGEPRAKRQRVDEEDDEEDYDGYADDAGLPWKWWTA